VVSVPAYLLGLPKSSGYLKVLVIIGKIPKLELYWKIAMKINYLHPSHRSTTASPGKKPSPISEKQSERKETKEKKGKGERI
jgi:hypothetical protein